MKYLSLIVLTLVCFGFRVRAQENCIPVLSKEKDKLAFQAGEEATYILRYKFGIINTDVATASVRLDSLEIQGQPAYHCKVFGQTAGIYRKMFNIKEDFQSWFSCDGVKPLRFYRNTLEGSYKSINNYTYRWDAEEPYIDAEIYNTFIDSTAVLRIPLKSCTFDLPSLYYFARNIDLSKIKADVMYPMTFAIDERSYDVYYIYKGKVRKKISGLGNVECQWFKAKLLTGEVFRGDHDMDIYVSDDLNRVPLFFSADLAVGHAQGRLKECSGLKYPMSWKK